jgi:hypothetical protein
MKKRVSLAELVDEDAGGLDFIGTGTVIDYEDFDAAQSPHVFAEIGKETGETFAFAEAGNDEEGGQSRSGSRRFSSSRMARRISAMVRWSV